MNDTSKRGRRSGTIKARVLTIALVPSAAALIVGIGLAGYVVNEGVQARQFAEDVRATLGPSSRFIVAVQEERRLTVLRLSTVGTSPRALDDQRRKVDTALSELTTANRRLAEDGSDDLRTDIAAFEGGAAQLDAARQRVDSGQAASQQAYDYYSDLLTLCGANIQGIARSAVDAGVGFEQMISYSLFKSAEAMSRGHAMAVRAVYGGLTPEQFHEFVQQIGMYHEQIEALVPRMTEDGRQSFALLRTTPAWKQSVAGDNLLMTRGPVRNEPVPFHVSVWENSAHQVGEDLIGLHVAHSDYAAELGADSGRRTLTTAIVTGSVILLVTVIAMLVAIRLSSLLIRRLTRLREQTLDLADRELPEVVRRLRAGETVELGRQTAAADQEDDEIGQVADAFDKARHTAIAATVQEAETRQGVRSVFLNIAHRSQVIVHRQLKVLDQAERSLEDPDQLKLLFQLDHLATRSRRNAENLVILGGGRPGRQWRDPVSLLEVVRSAVAETEQYTRVDAVRLPEVPLIGAAVADLIHLLAELVDNAASFSPPQAQVEVRGNLVGRGAVVEIEDQGLGIEPDQLDMINEMLRQPPDFSVMALSTEPRVGMFVVARLAARHQIKITLQESAYGGTRAIVLIPAALLATSSTTAVRTDQAVALVPAGQTEEPVSLARVRRPQRTGEPPVHRAAVRIGPSTESNGSSEPTTLSGQLPVRRNGSEQTDGRDSADENGHNGIEHNGTGQNVPEQPESGMDSTGPEHDALPEPARPEPTPGASSVIPPLPQRQRQANLAPQLAEAPGLEPEAVPDTGSGRAPEQSRKTMSAFQRGTLQARAARSDTEL